MEINIFDVAHGFCAYIIADNHNVMLIDCGYNEQTGFRPSDYLSANGCRGIEWFIVSNYDEDHLNDLPWLKQRLPIEIFWRNRSINVNELRGLKLLSGPILPGTETVLDMHADYVHNVPNPPEFPGIESGFFCNSYPEFQDTNNLSFVTFLHYRDIHIVFPGDLERTGWLTLLSQQAFREHLSRVNFFVASHHGRDSGYCAEVFDYCQPELVIISDEYIHYDTQEVDYRRHASGVSWGDHDRYVLTTRNDGMITISQRPGEGAYVNTAR